MNKVFVIVFLFLYSSLCAYAQVDDSKLDLSSPSNGKEEAAKYSSLLQEYYKNGEYELHKIYSDSLLLISELYGITDMNILALNSQAIYYKNRSNREKALEIYHKALDKCELMPDSSGPKAMILANMGNIYTDIGAFEKSIKAMDSLLVITDTVRRFTKIKAAALVGQSTNYLELKAYKKALQFAERAIDLGQSMKDEEVIGATLNNLSDIYIKLGDYESALKATEKGFLLADMQMLTKKRAWLLLNNGIANYHLKNTDVSLQSLKEALTLAQDKKIYEIAMYSYEYLAKVYEQKGNFKASYEAQKEYSRLSDLIKRDEKKATIADLSQDLSNNEKTLDAAQEKIITVTENKNRLAWYGGIFVFVIAGILLVYIKKKKQIEKEKKALQKQYTSLKKAIENKPTSSASKPENTPLKKEEKPYKNSSLTDVDREKYKTYILSLMKEEKPYLDPDLRLAELASKLGISTSHFSEVLHYCFKENFYNFINFYRVLEAQELMKKPLYKEAKIIAIAFDAGFKSKTTFNRVFKNFTGQTPSEYRETS
ncbi:helix-turn-helix domain-containing protein [Dokdonia ponticola]|uniref:Helix-turn-helix domain-containing protein n=1 Tax=Dokdonia ponticola TaxID=2041041 RepID=A0ABV9HS47_9FLAO